MQTRMAAFRVLLLLAAVTAMIGAQSEPVCDEHWEEFEDMCYWLNHRYLSWHHAVARCTKMKGSLVVPKSAKEDKFLKNMEHKIVNPTWLGIKKVGSQAGAPYIDPQGPTNQDLTYKNWAKGGSECKEISMESWGSKVTHKGPGKITSIDLRREYNARGSLCKEEATFGISGSEVWAKGGCRGAFSMCYNTGEGKEPDERYDCAYQTNGEWATKSCNIPTKSICVKAKGEPKQCSKGWRQFQGECFKIFFKNPKNWGDAKAACKKEGGDLASPTTPEYEHFLENMGGEMGWVNAQKVGGKLKWMDTEKEVEAFYSSVNPSWRHIEGGGDCLVDMYGVFWMEDDCDSLNEYICVKKSNAPNAPETTTAPIELVTEAEETISMKGFTAMSWEPFYTTCYPECNSKLYRGIVKVTQSGIPCMKWKDSKPHQHGYGNSPYEFIDMAMPHNFCRDTLNGGMGYPWCYTTDKKVLWEKCDVPKCEYSKCYPACDITQYKGTVNVTAENNDCMPWEDQGRPFTHEIGTEPYEFIDKALPANYCRWLTTGQREYVADHNKPWCFTMNKAQRSEMCDIPDCHSVKVLTAVSIEAQVDEVSEGAEGGEEEQEEEE